MSKRRDRLHAFVLELADRRVFRAVLVYLLLGVAVGEGADVFLPRLGLPDWTVTLVVALIILAFPFVVGVAWVFDITKEGVKRTPRPATDDGPDDAVVAPGHGASVSLPGTEIELQTLGGLRVFHEASEVVELPGQPRRAALLVYLVVEGGATRDDLVGLLWADRDPARARHALSQTLYELRSVLGEDWARQEGGQRLVPVGADADASRFERLVEEESWEKALALYEGPFLGGWSPPGAPEFEEWAEQTRSRLERLYRRCQRGQTRALQRAGDLEGALASARSWVEMAPLDDEAHHTLIDLLGKSGRRSQALERYEAYRSLVAEELDVEPLEETRTLVARIRERPDPAPHLVAEAPPAAAAAPAGEERPPATAVAVLPFRSLSADPEDDYFSQGITDELIVLLSKIGHLRVPSFTTVSRYRDTTLTSREIGRELGVGTLVQGSVRRLASRVRISAQVIDTATDTHIAAETFERELEDLFELQAETAQRIAGIVGAELTPLERKRLERRPTDSVRAYDLYLRARHLRSRQTDDAIDTGADLFRRAMEEDPDLSLALRSLLDSYGSDRLEGFQGRERELGFLHEELATAVGGEGRAVAVVGEPGIGKSSLVHRFRDSLDHSETPVFVGHSRAFGTPAPYEAFHGLVRSMLGIGNGRSEGVSGDAVGKALRDLDPALEARLPVFLGLLSVRDPDHPPPSSLTGEDFRREVHLALEELLGALGGKRTAVLVLEDWHRADEASEAALVHLLQRLKRFPVLVLVLFRSHYDPPWDPEAVPEVRLTSLSDGEVRALVQSFFGVGEVPAELASFVSRRTGGNPFFVEEVCRALVQNGSVYVDEDGVHVAHPLDEEVLPETVQDVLRGRIDRLDHVAAEALELASVLGSEISLRLLEEVAGSPGELPEALERLRQMDLVFPVPGRSEPSFEFRHEMTSEVAYQTVLRLRRKKLHEATGRAMEELAGEELEQHYEKLAYHFSRSQDYEKAVSYLEKAGDKAARSYALGHAREHYRNAIDFLDRRPPSRERTRQRIDLSFKWAEASVQAATRDQLELLERAHRDARELEDRDRTARALYWLGWIHYGLGDQRQALRHFRECVLLARELGDDRLLAQVHLNVGQCHAASTEYDKALESLERGISLRRGLPSAERSTGLAFAQGYVAMIHADLGRFDRARKPLEEALRIVTGMGRVSAEASVRTQAALIRFFQGDWQGCVTTARLIRGLAEEVGSFYIDAMSRSLEGYARFVTGEGGLDLLREAVERLEGRGAFLTMSWNYACLADALAQAGEREEGRRYGARALERAEVNDRLGEPRAHLALAELAAAEGDLETTRDEGERARRLWETRGSPRGVAIADFRLARLLAGLHGATEEAHSRATEAALSFGEMEMAWYREQAEAVARETGGG